MPAAAQGTDAAAAKAFATYWVQTLDYAAPRGDTSALSRASDQGCVQCQAIIELIDTVYAADGAIVGRGWTPTSSSVIHNPDGTVVVNMVVNVHRQTIIKKAGAHPRQFPGGRRVKSFWLSHSESSWRVTKLEQPE